MKLARTRYVYTAIVYTAIAIDVSAVWLTAVKTGDWFVPNGFTWIYSHSCHYAAASPNASVTFKTWWDQAYGMGKIFPLIEIRLKYLPRLGPMSPYVQARLQPSWAQQQFALFVASYTLSMFCIFHISWIKLDQIISTWIKVIGLGRLLDLKVLGPVNLSKVIDGCQNFRLIRNKWVNSRESLGAHPHHL